jgi:branched-chain amino acid transport system ATP-binding protein
MLRFKNINAHIQGAQVLRNVNITLPSSATASIIGRNGAGKTTLFRTLMGLITPTSGTIQFEDKELTSVDAYLRPGFGIGYSPEDRRIFRKFTVEQNLELPAKAIGLPPQEVRNRLEHVYDILPELKEMRQRSGGTVSGGQGKIIALGRALMIGKKLVLLDEPFQGLAPVLARRYADVLRDVRDKNPETTLIITESSPDLLRGFGDQTYQIERGEVSLIGSSI